MIIIYSLMCWLCTYMRAPVLLLVTIMYSFMCWLCRYVCAPVLLFVIIIMYSFYVLYCITVKAKSNTLKKLSLVFFLLLLLLFVVVVVLLFRSKQKESWAESAKTRELISAQKMSNKHNKDLSRLQYSRLACKYMQGIWTPPAVHPQNVLLMVITTNFC